MYLVSIGPNHNIGLAKRMGGGQLALTTVRSIEMNDNEHKRILFVPAYTEEDNEYIKVIVITPWNVTTMDGTFSANESVIEEIKRWDAAKNISRTRIVHSSRCATVYGVMEKYAISYVIGKCDSLPIERWLSDNMPIEEAWHTQEWKWHHADMMEDFCYQLPEINGAWRSFYDDDLPVLF